MESVKFDGDKPKMSLIPPHAAFAMARALTYGAKKYDSYNYKNGKGLDWDRYTSALMRHLYAWMGGEEFDPESKLRHTDHVLACAAMLSDSVESKIGKDTRFEHECCHHNFILGEPNCVYCGLSYDVWTGYKIK